MKAGIRIAGMLLAGMYLLAQAPSAPKEPPSEVKGDESIARAGSLPARETPADYQFRAQMGKYTLAAEFQGHSIRTLEGGPYRDEDFLTLEVALFGPAGEKLPISYQDFSLRINGKKTPTPASPYLEIFKSLKDPEWEPPEQKVSKTSVNGGADGQNADLPRLTHIPIERERAMQQRVMKISLGEGLRPLPQAGVVFFDYHGNEKSIRSIELMYAGPAGKATLALH